MDITKPRIYQRVKYEGGEYVHIDLYEKEKAAREKNHKQLFHSQEGNKSLLEAVRQRDNQIESASTQLTKNKGLIEMLRVKAGHSEHHKSQYEDLQKRFSKLREYNEKLEHMVDKLKSLLKEVL